MGPATREEPRRRDLWSRNREAFLYMTNRLDVRLDLSLKVLPFRDGMSQKGTPANVVHLLCVIVPNNKGERQVDPLLFDLIIDDVELEAEVVVRIGAPGANVPRGGLRHRMFLEAACRLFFGEVEPEAFDEPWKVIAAIDSFPP